MNKICFRSVLLLLIIVGMNSCSRRPITVFSEYVSQESLASYSVNTPDPHLNCPAVGQKLYISWNVPDCFCNQFPLELKLVIRFRNRAETVQTFAINKKMGSYVYQLLGDEYFEKEGIFSYKIQLLHDQDILDEWRHQIWVDLITFPEIGAREGE